MLTSVDCDMSTCADDSRRKPSRSWAFRILPLHLVSALLPSLPPGSRGLPIRRHLLTLTRRNRSQASPHAAGEEYMVVRPGYKLHMSLDRWNPQLLRLVNTS